MKQRDDALDLVRLVAAVMIVVFHFNSMFAPKGDVSAGPLRYANGSFGNSAWRCSSFFPAMR